MINFKQREFILPSALMLLSILVLGGTLAYMLLVPEPNAAGVVKGRAASRRKIEGEIEQAKERNRAMQQQVRPRLWEGNTEAITASVLAKITNEVNRRNLRMTAFRPQKPQMLENLTELPYTVQLAGPFPAVRETIRTFDAPGSKLAVRSLQIASADGASSEVTASLAVCAYTAPSAIVGRAKPTQTGSEKAGNDEG